MILPTTNGVDKDVDDLYGDQFTVVLARAATTLECAPYWHSGEKAPTRLTRAIELVRLSRVSLQDDRLATVHGSTKPYDVTGFHCTCPQSQKGPSSWCVHAVAVKLARTMASQAPREATLPLGPTTVDERLAAAAHDAQARALALSTMPDSTALSTNHTPQEDRMADDQYIPEPDDQDAPVAVVERVERKEEKKEGLQPRVPQVDDLEAALQVWTTERAVVQRFLKQELKANIDYYTLRIGNKDSKPSLSKAGAEKVLGWLKIQASFTPDTGTWEMLGRPTDLVCYVCTLRTRSGEIVGEGRGARSLKKDGGDVNKAIKMAEKSACVSAVLRTGALSDVFTCDLEDMQEEPAKPAATPAKPTGQEYRQRIWAQVQDLAPQVKTREAVEAFIKARTGMDLHPDQYQAILENLSGAGR